MMMVLTADQNLAVMRTLMTHYGNVTDDMQHVRGPWVEVYDKIAAELFGPDADPSVP